MENSWSHCRLLQISRSWKFTRRIGIFHSPAPICASISIKIITFLCKHHFLFFFSFYGDNQCLFCIFSLLLIWINIFTLKLLTKLWCLWVIVIQRYAHPWKLYPYPSLIIIKWWFNMPHFVILFDLINWKLCFVILPCGCLNTIILNLKVSLLYFIIVVILVFHVLLKSSQVITSKFLSVHRHIYI